MWVTFSAMTDVAQASGSLGLVDRVAALHRIQLFAGIPGRVLAAVGEAALEERFEAGQTLMAEGAVEAHLYAIVEGRVRVHRGPRTLLELGPGATVGELAVLVPAPRAADVSALEPTLLLRVDKSVLDELLVDWPELADGVIAELVTRLRSEAEFAERSS
jgi:CRP/FNR family transcriptional regulator, cyclic AMP receptor protein